MQQIKTLHQERSPINTQCDRNHLIKPTDFRQVVEKKLPDVFAQLRVNHCFLSYFVSVGVLELEHVDHIMQVNGKVS